MNTQALTLSAWAARRRPDEDIFDRTLRGDPVAFSEVYRRYQKRIYGYCLARSLDRDAASDATQEVFMRLLRAEPGSIENPTAWLFTVARNVVIDAARKHGRTPEDATAVENDLAWDRLKAADTADEVLARSDARDVFLALRTMNPRYRTALVMREIHGESAKDMAEALETTPGAVDTLVSRARDAFGVAYAAVGDLPAACRSSIELMYRKHGTGITPEEDAALQEHLAGCERCRAEAKKADDPKHLGALLPYLVPAGLLGHGLLHKAALTVRSVPEVAVQHASATLMQPATWNLGQKIAAGLVAAALVTAPIAAVTTRHAAAQSAAASERATDPPTAHGSLTAAMAHPGTGGMSPAAEQAAMRSAGGSSMMSSTSGKMGGSTGSSHPTSKMGSGSSGMSGSKRGPRTGSHSGSRGMTSTGSSSGSGSTSGSGSMSGSSTGRGSGMSGSGSSH
jgi:RNA polymerase sigma-70 factor (ECF subfamily)